MPKDNSRGLSRIFKNRVDGIFKKASALHEINNQARIAIFIEKPGVTPYVFTSDEEGFDWPCGAAEYSQEQHPVIKRPSNFCTLSDSISRGEVQLVKRCSLPPYAQLMNMSNVSQEPKNH
ncbi:hypothetical protein BS50DRAFT_566291 [Corynespora cassiicola Philippines]|uniref:MADS-box domain-containing protein n=1 Tax=Corynespora cassiicola Philippines TaxID=1448308 RepID=A0A2T2N0N1_CORCC|nr:hypothetical protein BS50DRAFT_566291 [Corynespora cassiicola Philippines]